MLAGYTLVQHGALPTGPVNLQSAFFVVEHGEYQSQLPLDQMAFVFTQYAQTAPEVKMVDLVFPELIGLSWDTGMKPLFKNKIAEHTSGKETRTSFWEDPLWEFNLSYDYLPNKSDFPTTDLKRIVAFFLRCQGSFEEFLFKAPNFNRVQDRLLLEGDGNTVEVDLVADIDGYLMPVGYIDASKIVLTLQQVEDIVAHPDGSLSLTYPHKAVVAYVKQGTTVINRVQSNPDVNQYVFDALTGQLQFNTARGGQTFEISYTAQLRPGTEYTLLPPRTLALNRAPEDGSVLMGTYEYYFVCRFMDDELELAQFSDRLWNLQEVSFRSIAL